MGDKVKMFDFEPTFLVFAGVTAGIVALLAGLADLKYDWIGSVGRILKTKLDLKVETIIGPSERS